MEVTLGKISWAISILIFLFLLYNNDAVDRVTTLTEEQVIVQYQPEEKINTEEGITSPAGMEPLTEMGVESSTMIVREAELYMMIERLSWEIELIDEQLTDIKIEMAELTNDKDTTSSNLLALITALTPLLIPVVTSKLGIHNKQIGRKV